MDLVECQITSNFGSCLFAFAASVTNSVLGKVESGGDSESEAWNYFCAFVQLKLNSSPVMYPGPICSFLVEFLLPTHCMVLMSSLCKNTLFGN
jgi:hypothetical protein